MVDVESSSARVWGQNWWKGSASKNCGGTSSVTSAQSEEENTVDDQQGWQNYSIKPTWGDD